MNDTKNPQAGGGSPEQAAGEGQQSQQAQQPIKGPWPDHQAREEMSDQRSTRQNAGKHAKNPDWQKKW